MYQASSIVELMLKQRWDWIRARGGLEAERSERQQVQAEEAERHKQEFERLQRIRSEGFRKVRASFWGKLSEYWSKPTPLVLSAVSQ